MKSVVVILGLVLALLTAPCLGPTVARAEDAGHAAAAHGGGEANPLAWRTDLALWTAVVFLALLLVLGKFAWKPIIEGLDRREQRIAHEIAEAEQRNLSAQRSLEEYQRKLEAAAAEARAVVAEAHRRAEQQGHEIVEQARAEAQAEVNKARREIEVATDGALKDLAERSADLAVQLAGRIVGSSLSPDQHTRLIERTVAEFVERKPSLN